MSEVALLSYLASISFVGLFFVSSFLHVIRRERSHVRMTLIQAKKPPFYIRFQRFFLKENSVEALVFCTASVQQILRLFYLLFSLAAFIEYFDTTSLFFWRRAEDTFEELRFVSFFIVIMLSLILLADLLPRLWAYYSPKFCLKFSLPIATLFLLLFSPLSFVIFGIVRFCLPKSGLSPFSEPAVGSKEKLFDLIREMEDDRLLGEHDKKLLHAVLTFRDRIVREVMVPRVNLFCLPETCSIREAGHLLQKEGYSRVPVYKNTPDHIVGMLMYKDIIAKYMQYEEMQEDSSFLDTPIEGLVKTVLYTPETKKIANLLQEFRKKQMHLAVVVDEYGGTAGVVTIEDILEEIVGDIADEYDETEVLVQPAGRGGWIVDGRANLLDLDEEIGIKIPQEGEYDTIAGYVFFRLGTIPKKGVILHHDAFELEILSSGDRFVEKVKITPLPKSDR